ncbi:MAG TPA: heme ABC transporter ATP-binding protein [Gemmatimonadaceae bacterium]|nr:heme ABC transporter ATP-binding protein [Gemmatimonadaceae bacterium]
MAEARGVSHHAGRVTILHDVSARFERGRFNVILGPNGAGKSTLLRIATGLLRPTAGGVWYDDRPVTELGAESLARRRAVLSQHVDLAFPLAVHEVVLMGRYPHFARVPSAADLEIVTRALDLVGMTAKRDQAYPTLSGGERQKVQLARVLAQIWNADPAPPAQRAPRYLFLDEPTASLDIHYQHHLLGVVRSLLGEECTVVAVLHDLNLAAQYGDRFLLLEGGRVALETDGADSLPPSLIERVFGVRARRIVDPADGGAVWRIGP